MSHDFTPVLSFHSWAGKGCDMFWFLFAFQEVFISLFLFYTLFPEPTDPLRIALYLSEELKNKTKNQRAKQKSQNKATPP